MRLGGLEPIITSMALAAEGALLPTPHVCSTLTYSITVGRSGGLAQSVKGPAAAGGARHPMRSSPEEPVRQPYGASVILPCAALTYVCSPYTCAAANKTTIQKMNAARHLQVLMTYPNEKIAQQVRSACALCRNLNQPNPTLGICCEGSTGAAQFGRRLREMTPAALLCAHPLSLRVSVSVSYLVFILVAAIRYIHTYIRSHGSVYLQYFTSSVSFEFSSTFNGDG